LYFWAFLSICMPAATLYGLRRQDSPASLFVLALPLFLFLLLIGRWDLVSYTFRYLVLFAFVFLGGYNSGWALPTLTVASTCFLWFLLSRRPRAGSVVELQFPLHRGTFCIVQGGATSWVNRHHVSTSQRFALDIVALNKIGARAKGIYPSRLEDYRVFGENVYSPCGGIITAAVDHLPDMPPAQWDTKNIAGNYIVIRLDENDICVGLAHLQQGSLSIKPGEQVKPGQFLARVGNSGNTTEPHLHIHAKRGGRHDSMLDGEGVPMRFGGRWFIRNSIVQSRHPPVQAPCPGATDQVNL
jgi:hypothetical protein